jgi:hypothetical protein
MLNNYIVKSTNRLREIYKTEAAAAAAHTPPAYAKHMVIILAIMRNKVPLVWFIFSHIFTREFARHQHLNITWRYSIYTVN